MRPNGTKADGATNTAKTLRAAQALATGALFWCATAGVTSAQTETRPSGDAISERAEYAAEYERDYDKGAAYFEAQLKELNGRFTEQHPSVVALRASYEAFKARHGRKDPEVSKSRGPQDEVAARIRR